MISHSVVAAIDDRLRPHGFHVRKAIWNRKRDSFVDVVSLQMDISLSEFAVNVGVLYPHAYTLCFGKTIPAVVSDIHCTARWRLRESAPAVEWWSVGDLRALTGVARLLEEHTLPIMDGLHSLEMIERFLADHRAVGGSHPPEEVYRAIVLADLGRMPQARSVLAELSAKALDPWRARIAEVEHRLAARAI